MNEYSCKLSELKELCAVTLCQDFWIRRAAAFKYFPYVCWEGLKKLICLLCLQTVPDLRPFTTGPHCTSSPSPLPTPPHLHTSTAAPTVTLLPLSHGPSSPSPPLSRPSPFLHLHPSPHSGMGPWYSTQYGLKTLEFIDVKPPICLEQSPWKPSCL